MQKVSPHEVQVKCMCGVWWWWWWQSQRQNSLEPLPLSISCSSLCSTKSIRVRKSVERSMVTMRCSISASVKARSCSMISFNTISRMAVGRMPDSCNMCSAWFMSAKIQISERITIPIFKKSPKHPKLSTKTLLTMVENCGKIIDKKRLKNLENPGTPRLIQHFESTKKVSSFLIMTFQHQFSQVLAQLLRANLSTLSVMNRVWITFAWALIFNPQRYFRIVDNLFIPQNLMWGTIYANLRAIFYAQFPQAITIHIKFFLEK